jgi:hypothetical protein
LLGVEVVLDVEVDPALLGSRLRFVAANTNIVRVSGGPPQLTVTGLAVGATEIQARMGTNELCATKNATVFHLRLMAVGFFGTNISSVLRDDGGGPYTTNNTHWTASNSAPVTYVRNSHPACSAVFSFTGAVSQPILIRGDGNYPIPVSTNTPSGGYFVTPILYAATALPNQVDYINPLAINWRVSFDNGASYLVAGTSTNPVYVTLKTPETSNLFHTVVHLACSRTGATDTNASLANTWSFFISRDVRTWDGRTLFYYRAGLPFGSTCTTAEDLLKRADGNGQCTAFADLLADSLGANGVPWGAVIVQHIQTNRFLAKDWVFGTASYSNSTPSSAPYIWQLKFATNAIDMVPVPSGGLYGDLANSTSLAGQNTQPPAEKVFLFHFVVRAGSGGTYYDPSYGITYTNALDLESKAIDGYAIDFGDSTSTNKILRVKKAQGLNEMRFIE